MTADAAEPFVIPPEVVTINRGRNLEDGGNFYKLFPLPSSVLKFKKKKKFFREKWKMYGMIPISNRNIFHFFF